jgi:hypothetical protein
VTPVKAKYFLPYPAPMSMWEQSREDPYVNTTKYRTWKVWEEDATIKYILETVPSQLSKLERLPVVVRKLKENENRGLGTSGQRTAIAISAWWYGNGSTTPSHRNVRCGLSCEIEKMKPSPINIGKENRLRVLADFYNDRVKSSKKHSNFSQLLVDYDEIHGGVFADSMNIHDRPDGNIAEDAKNVIENINTGPSSHIPRLNLHEFAFKEAYAMSPRQALDLDLPELEVILNIRGAMAFNPFVTFTQCQPIFQTIDKQGEAWQKKTFSPNRGAMTQHERIEKKKRFA